MLSSEDKQEIDTLSDFELADYTKNMLSEMATDGAQDNDIYVYTRYKFLSNNTFTSYVPSWIKTNRTVKEYWGFIKIKYPSYAERREFIKNEFSDLLNYLEFSQSSPIEQTIVFNESHIHQQWEKALSRKVNDPEGAITIARTLIESTLKFILDEKHIEYRNNIDLSELYKEVAKSLNLAPEQHQEQIFKQILGGANGIISGIGSLRNKLGDSHGSSKTNIKPQERHSELAVNMSGSMAIFLLKTFKEQS